MSGYQNILNTQRKFMPTKKERVRTLSVSNLVENQKFPIDHPDESNTC